MLADAHWATTKGLTVVSDQDDSHVLSNEQEMHSILSLGSKTPAWLLQTAYIASLEDRLFQHCHMSVTNIIPEIEFPYF